VLKRGEVIWAPDPFSLENQNKNPRPWLVISTEKVPYPQEECIAIALTTQSHHPGSMGIKSEDWITGEPDRDSYVLPWTPATLKLDVHLVGVQGKVRDDLVDGVTKKTVSYIQG
jgi:mRNA-degrading endonuclease toxin of MazEF toxin-antitoxin module